jgi:hypothetical protein
MKLVFLEKLKFYRKHRNTEVESMNQEAKQEKVEVREEKPKKEKIIKPVKPPEARKKPKKQPVKPIAGAPIITKIRKIKRDLEIAEQLLDMVEKNPSTYQAFTVFWNNIQDSIKELEKITSRGRR